MKTKKLTLTSGILLVICASLSIIGLVAVIEELVNTLLFTPINVEGNETYILTYLVVSIYQICLYIAQGIVYMIFGIKLIKRSTPASDGQANKKILIASIVCVGCSLLFDPVDVMKLLYVALIPILSCALSFDTKTPTPPENRPVYLYGTNKNGKDLGGVNLDEFGHVISDKPYPVVGEDGKVEYIGGSDVTSNPVEEKTSVNLEQPKSDSNTSLDESKLASLNELKNNGVISEDEYNAFVSKIISKSETKPTTDDAKIKSAPKKPRATKSAQDSTDKSSTKKATTKKSEPNEENK